MNPQLVPRGRLKELLDGPVAAAERDNTPAATGKLAVPEENIFGRTTVVKDMHTRKRMMAQEVIAGGPGSGFIALSGGNGICDFAVEELGYRYL